LKTSASFGSFTVAGMEDGRSEIKDNDLIPPPN